jgi:hypothetical protein
VLEFLERFSVAKDHDDAEIERLLQAGPIYGQRAAKAHVVDTAEAAKRVQSAQKNILVVNVAGRFSQNSITWVTCRNARWQPVRWMNSGKEQGKSEKSERAYEKMHLRGPTQSLKTYQPASIFDRPFRTCLREESSPRGKRRARSTDFFQSRNFCAALKNKVQIFACRFFSAFLISRRWHGGRESSGVNKV